MLSNYILNYTGALGNVLALNLFWNGSLPSPDPPLLCTTYSWYNHISQGALCVHSKSRRWWNRGHVGGTHVRTFLIIHGLWGRSYLLQDAQHERLKVLQQTGTLTWSSRAHRHGQLNLPKLECVPSLPEAANHLKGNAPVNRHTFIPFLFHPLSPPPLLHLTPFLPPPSCSYLFQLQTGCEELELLSWEALNKNTMAKGWGPGDLHAYRPFALRREDTQSLSHWVQPCTPKTSSEMGCWL